MKKEKLFLTVIFVSFIIITASSQSDTIVQNKKTYLGLDFGIGFIAPADINEQLDNYANYHGIEFSRGNSHINIAYILGFSLDYFVVKNLEIKGEVEVGWGIKQIKVMLGSGYINSLLRLSGGLYSNYHLFLDNTSSIYFGGGFNYNYLMLSAFDQNITGKSTPIGLSFQVGFVNFELNRRNTRRRFFYELQGNIIKGTNTKVYEDEWDRDVSEISFSGISIKAGYKF